MDPQGGASPAGQIAELSIEGSFQDPDKIRSVLAGRTCTQGLQDEFLTHALTSYIKKNIKYSTFSMIQCDTISATHVAELPSLTNSELELELEPTRLSGCACGGSTRRRSAYQNNIYQNKTQRASYQYLYAICYFFSNKNIDHIDQ